MQSFAKRELVRVVRLPDGLITVDLTGKKSGRGAYICKNPECLAKAQKARRLEKNLECTIPDEIYEQLKGALSVDE